MRALQRFIMPLVVADLTDDCQGGSVIGCIANTLCSQLIYELEVCAPRSIPPEFDRMGAGADEGSVVWRHSVDWGLSHF